MASSSHISDTQQETTLNTQATASDYKSVIDTIHLEAAQSNIPVALFYKIIAECTAQLQAHGTYSMMSDGQKACFVEHKAWQQLFGISRPFPGSIEVLASLNSTDMPHGTRSPTTTNLESTSHMSSNSGFIANDFLTYKVSRVQAITSKPYGREGPMPIDRLISATPKLTSTQNSIACKVYLPPRDYLYRSIAGSKESLAEAERKMAVRLTITYVHQEQFIIFCRPSRRKVAHKRKQDTMDLLKRTKDILSYHVWGAVKDADKGYRVRTLPESFDAFFKGNSPDCCDWKQTVEPEDEQIV